MRLWWSAWVPAAVLAQLVVAQPAWSGDELEEQTKARLREVRLRVRPEGLAPPGACDDLDLDALEVSVRGRPVPRELLEELERTRRPTIHALLIDTSQSAAGKLDFYRSAAEAYVRRLEPGQDTALVASFDENVVLAQGETSDRDALIEAIRGIRMGHDTALNDGLYFVLRELEAHRERPVIVLLTDGFDTTSMHSRDEIHELNARRPDLSVFVIGYAVPPITGNGPTGMLSTPRFFNRLTTRTNGAYFDVFTHAQLDRAFEQIRRMLRQEATLTFLDPDPEAEPGRIRVASRDPECGIELFRDVARPEPAARHLPIAPPYPDPPLRLPLVPSPAYRKYYVSGREEGHDPDCPPPPDGRPEEEQWYLDVEPRRMHGCALDVTLETGIVYDYSVLRMRENGWIQQKTRPLEIDVPPPPALPTRVEQIMPFVADHAVATAGDPLEPAPLAVPVERHARPYHDQPLLGHGKVFFELRPALARALFAYPDYRAWVGGKLDEEARRELAALAERFRTRAASSGSTDLDTVVRMSRQGREILRRAENPAEVDLQEYLAAWLGDITAHELFVRWEVERINRMLDGDAPGFESFRERWVATRRLFFVPSYARILTLYVPVWDTVRDRIGYWRVVLPRASWMPRRVKGYRRRTDYADLPLDLVPDLPLALWAVERAREEDPRFHAALREGRRRVAGVRYELLGKSYRHDPQRGFRHTRVEVRFGDETGAGELCLTADVVLKDGEPGLEARAVSYPGLSGRAAGTP